MPIARFQLPDGRVARFEVPEGTSPEQAEQLMSQHFAAPQQADTARGGVGDSFKRGLEQMLSTARTSLESTFGDKNAAMEAALQRKNVIGEKYGQAPGWEEVKKKYEKDGLLSAAGEYVSQIPGALAEQAPQIGTSLASARLGATAGPAGAVVGATVPSYTQAYGSLLEREAEEQRKRGEAVDPSRLKAAGLAVPYTALDVAATYIPMGKGIIKSIFGDEVASLLSRGATKAAEEVVARKLSKEGFLKSLGVGTVKGAAVEIPTEVGQQVLERIQAGLPLFNADAWAEYGQTAFEISKLGLMGAAGRFSDKSQARKVVQTADAEIATAAAKAAQDEETARRATPEHALDVGARFDALRLQEKELSEQRGNKLAKDATDEQKDLFEQQTQQLKDVRNKLKELAPDYKEIKAKLPSLREQLRVEGMSPQDYYYEQMGMKSDAEVAADKTKAPSEQDPMKAWLDQTATVVPPRPDSQLRKEFDEALGGLRHFDMLTPADAADVLSRDPLLLQKVYNGDFQIEEFNAKQNRELKDALKLQIKDLAAQMSQGREKIEGDKKALADKMVSETSALQRIGEDKTETPVTTNALVEKLTKQAEEKTPLVAVEPGLQKQNYRAAAETHTAEAEDALVSILEATTDIEQGHTLDTTDADKRKFASATTDILRQRIEADKQRYAESLLNEVANLRQADNQQPLNADITKSAVAQLRSALDAYSTGQSSEATLKRKLDVMRAKLLTYRPELQKQGLPTEGPLSAQSNYREAQRIAEERGETAKSLEGQLRRKRDYVGGLIERVLPMGATITLTREARTALTDVQAAIENGTATNDMLDRAEDIASRAVRGQPIKGDAEGLRDAIRSMQQAQGPGVEGGQQSLFEEKDPGTMGLSLANIRATAANFRKFLASKPVAALRALIPKVEAVIKAEPRVQDRPAVDAEFYSKRIDTLENKIKEAKDSLEELGNASWEFIMEIRGVLPEEVRIARQKLYALMQEQNKLELEQQEAIKQEPTSNRAPYAAAHAQDKAAKLKSQIENKQTSILQSMQTLTKVIREQRKEAIYSPIIQQFEKQAAAYEEQLAKLQEEMPQDGSMSPELDDLYNDAATLKDQIRTVRSEIEKVRERAEEGGGNEALLAAADTRIVKEKEKLAALQKKLADVDFVGEERRLATAQANKLRQETAVAETKLAEAKEINSKQNEARRMRVATGSGLQKVTRTVVPVERTTPSGKKIVMKERGTGLPLQQKKTTGAYSERSPVKGVNWTSTKVAKPTSKENQLSLVDEKGIIEERREKIREAAASGDTAEVARLRAEGREERVAKAARVSAEENTADFAKVAGTLSRQSNVTDITPRPKSTKTLDARAGAPSGPAIKREMTHAEKMKLAKDFKEGMAFRTADTSGVVVDPTEAKARIVEIKSRLPKGMNLIYEPTLEGMKPETMEMLKDEGYKEGLGFKGAVLSDGTIVVVGDQHASMTDLEETIFHEMIGHYSIDTIIGLKKLKEFAHATDLEKLARELGGDKLWNDALNAMTFAVTQKGDPDLAALREIIAYTAQQRITESFKEKASRWLKQLVGMVRAGLREMGFKNMTAMSTSDVFYAIKEANKAYNARTLGPYRAADGTMAFRTKSEPSRYGKSFVAQEKSIKDKLLGNLLGLSGRVQFVDQYAALDAVLKKGLDAKVISDLEAEQALHYLRFAPQSNAYATQALSNGPLSLVKQMTKRGAEFIFKSSPGDSMVKVADALQKSGIKNGTELEAMFTIYMAGKRAKQVGWEKLNFDNPSDAKQEHDTLMAELRGNDKARVAFEEAAKIYKGYNNGMLDFLVQTGYLGAAKAAELKAIDYVPFYRADANGNLNLFVDKEHPVRIANIKDEPSLHELVGDNKQILPIFASSAQNAFVLTRMGLRNQMMKDNAMLLKRMGVASKIGKGAGPAGRDTVRYKVNGEDNFAVIDTDMYGIPAELIVKGMEGIKTTLPMIIKLMGKPANILRQFVTRNPAYALRQVIRDPLTAALTTGTDSLPVLSSMKEIASMVAGRSETERKLMESGAIASSVLTGGEEDMAKIMREMSMGKPGWAKAFAKLDALAMQGDAATRAVIYKDSIAKGMSDMQALTRTLESMNFSRRGLSPTIQMLSTMIPFFNAQIQGLDVLYRAFKGQMPYSEQLKIREKLYTRGLLLAAGTIAYASAMEDDEAYKEAKPEERLGNWFVHTPFAKEPLRIPIPFELGYLFKALPEAVWNMASDDARASDITKGMGKLIALSNPFSLPQAIKPLTEVVLGKSFFGGDIESHREITNMMPTERSRESTTEVAKYLGKLTGNMGLTPIKIDYLIRGYTGGLGIAIASLANPILNTEAGATEKPSTKASNLPFIGGMFQPVEGRGTLDAAYERMLEVQQADGMFNTLINQGKKEEAITFAKEYGTRIANASLSGAVQKQLGEYAELRRTVIASGKTTAEKDDLLEKIELAERKYARAFLKASD